MENENEVLPTEVVEETVVEVTEETSEDVASE